MKTITNALVGTVAAGAMALVSASPAMARENDRHDGISTGDVVAGALVLGGIAAIASASSHNNLQYGGRSNGYGYGYNRAGDPRGAVAQCVAAAERSANRYSYGGSAKVTDVRDIDAKRDGFNVKGRIAVNTMGRNWRNGDRAYGNGWGGDYRGWNNRYRGYDAGSFTCKVRYGRVVDLDFSGIRGL